MYKKCSKCGVEKLLTVEFFVKNKNSKTGFTSQCRKCFNLYSNDRAKMLREKELAEYKLIHGKDKIINRSGGDSYTCMRCGETKPRTNEYFHKGKKSIDGLTPWCKKCTNTHNKTRRKEFKEEKGISYSTLWGSNNRNKKREIDRNCNKKMKQQLIQAYGGCCTCCGETNEKFLTLEHINHDGKEHRELVGGKKSRGGYKIYLDVKKQGYPNTYTILCMNCNFAEKQKQPCPHKSFSLVELVKTNKLVELNY